MAFETRLARCLDRIFDIYSDELAALHT